MKQLIAEKDHIHEALTLYLRALSLIHDNEYVTDMWLDSKHGYIIRYEKVNR
jgi:hypothetical protein